MFGTGAPQSHPRIPDMSPDQMAFCPAHVRSCSVPWIVCNDIAYLYESAGGQYAITAAREDKQSLLRPDKIRDVTFFFSRKGGCPQMHEWEDGW